MATMTSSSSRPISPDERSGVLRPTRLAQFAARWIEPHPAVRDVVDTYWTVSWDLAPGEQLNQRIIDFPAITLSVEEGDVAARLVISAVRRDAWSRSIHGHGTIFALRLRPAGLACLSDLPPTALRPEQALTDRLDGRSHGLLACIADRETAAERAARADQLIRRALEERPPKRVHLLANRALDALVSSPRVRPPGDVAAELGVSERTLQRVLRATVGLSPYDVARRIRLQEVVRLLTAPGAEISAVATQLGYVDQAHLTNEFRVVAGVTPGQYIRELQDD